MKVLVTGASGVFGRAAIDRLVMEGHEVAGISRGRPKNLPPTVTWTSVDIRDAEGVTKAMAGADAVVHNAWALTQLETEQDTWDVDVGGTQNVLSAMSVTGTPRLVHTSSVMAYGAHPDNPPLLAEDSPLRPSPDHLYSLHKLKCEELITASGVEALFVRAANAVGRHVGNVTAQGFGGPVIPTIKGYESHMQYVHPEDLGRFYALAVVSDRTGPINVAADGTVTLAGVAKALGRRTVELPASFLKKVAAFAFAKGLTDLDPGSFDAMMWFPIVDTTRMKQEWGFRCAYTSEEAVHDFGRSMYWYTFLGNRRLEIPWRIKYPEEHLPDNIPPSDGTELQPASEYAGEFDSLVDPRYATYTAANVSEAFAGPMTPLSVEYAGKALRCSAEAMAHTLDLPPELAEPLSHRAINVFGHGIYGNLSIIHRMARAMPGYDQEAWNQALFGGADADAIGAELSHEPLGTLGERAQRALRMGPRFANFGTECRHVARVARELAISEDDVRAMPDERLEARLNSVFDALVHAWTIAGNASAFVANIFELVEGDGGELSRGGMAELESAGAIRGVAELADKARADEVVRVILESKPAAEALEAIRDRAPSFAAAFDRLLSDYGHRGPRETELSSTVFADDPPMLLDAIAKRMQAGATAPPEPTPSGDLKTRMVSNFGHSYQRHREISRDAVVRLTHLYRVTAREQARRLVERGVIDQVEDGFYLLKDQLLVPPRDARDVVARRRAERDRLASYRMPVMFHETWEPVETDADPLDVGETIQGMPASVGEVTGLARVMGISDLGSLQPGEILVTELTDTGWTPLFSYAGAVVTNVGGQMSHAAVVAREFGIPCVVQATDATHRIRTGQKVRVDGAAGTVTAID